MGSSEPSLLIYSVGPYSGNTSHPLLFVSTSLDPVTPLARYLNPPETWIDHQVNFGPSAKKMSRSFPGSVVLEQQSEGVSIFVALVI